MTAKNNDAIDDEKAAVPKPGRFVAELYTLVKTHDVTDKYITNGSSLINIIILIHELMSSVEPQVKLFAPALLKLVSRLFVCCKRNNFWFNCVTFATINTHMR